MNSLQKKSLDVNVVYPKKVYQFFQDNPNSQIYVIAGGRGKSATWSIGQKLVVRSFEKCHFILCTREIKETVDHSSRRTIERLIQRMGLEALFEFQKTRTINKVTGAEITYTGLSKVTEDNVQGLEGITIAWLGEAHAIEMSSYQKFEPTIREEGATIYIDYNVRYTHTPIHTLFTQDPSANGWPYKGKQGVPGLAYLFMSYTDNELISQSLLETAKRNKKQYSLPDWEWIWLGKVKDATERYIANESDVLNAMDRELPTPKYGRKYVGADIAHMGGDEIVFYMRIGDKVIKTEICSMMKVPETIERLEAFMEYDKEVYLNIDNGHVGAGVADELEDRGYVVCRINFGGKEKLFDPDHSADTVTDMAFSFVDCLKTADIPKDDILKNQIIQRRWDFLNEKGIRKIESKDKFKEHASNLEGHTSPDRGDAIFLCFYPTDPVTVVSLGSVI